MKIKLPCEFITVLALVIITGCTVVQPFPTTAKAGDTITLAVGSPDGMKRSNTTVFYTPDTTGVTRDISSGIRAIAKLTPDKASRAYQNSFEQYIPYYSGHEVWFTVMALDLPSDLQVASEDITIMTTASYPTHERILMSALYHLRFKNKIS